MEGLRDNLWFANWFIWFVEAYTREQNRRGNYWVVISIVQLQTSNSAKLREI